jgi:hypothetical protein
LRDTDLDRIVKVLVVKPGRLVRVDGRAKLQLASNKYDTNLGD